MFTENNKLERGQFSLQPAGIKNSEQLQGKSGLLTPYLILPQSHPEFESMLKKLKTAEEQGMAFSLTFEPETDTTIAGFFQGLTLEDQLTDIRKGLGSFVFVTTLRKNQNEHNSVVINAYNISPILFEELSK